MSVTCFKCHKELHGLSYVVHDNHVYCGQICIQKVEQQSYTLNRVCATCGCVINFSDGFGVYKKKPYCSTECLPESSYFKKYAHII